MVASAVGAADAPDDDTEKKEIRPLDDADIALLKTYVRCRRAARRSRHRLPHICAICPRTRCPV
jgi:hypothetical protein